MSEPSAIICMDSNHFFRAQKDKEHLQKLVESFNDDKASSIGNRAESCHYWFLFPCLPITVYYLGLSYISTEIAI